MSSIAGGRHCFAPPVGVLVLVRPPRVKASDTTKTNHTQPVCAPVARPQHLGRRGLLAALILCAWQSALGQAPTTPVAIPETITVHGVALDDSLNVPIPGLWIYLNDTKYGAITDAKGAFSFSFPTGWKPVRGGIITIKVVPVPFTFKYMRVPLDWRKHDPAQPLTLRLTSAPERGRPNMYGSILMAPPVPPPVYPSRSHTSRP